MVATRHAIASIIMVAAVTVCGYSQTTPPKELTATISGKVTVQGKAVAGVVISLRSNEGTSYRKLLNQRGITDANGEYRITNVPSGSYIVAPVTAAFVASVSNAERTLIVNKAEAVEDFDFSLMPGGVITGRVVDPDGRPVIEEEIHLFGPVRESVFGSPMPATITDDRGVYRIFGLKPGGYKIAAGREDDPGPSGQPRAVHMRTYYPGINDFAQATVIQVAEGTEAANIDITLSRLLTTYTASGRIVDGETGQPLPNVTFGFTRFSSANSISGVGRAGVTNERGEFTFGKLAPGQYALSVASGPERYLRVEEVRFDIIDQDVTGLVIKTLKGAGLSGVMVLDGTYDKAIREKFLESPLVVFIENEATRTAGGISGVRAAMSPDGRFRIGGLPAGRATFSFGGPPSFRIVRIERDGIIHLHDLAVKQGESITGLRIVVAYADASLRGAIEVENGPLPPNGRLFVWARRLNEESSRAHPGGQIDARGHFVFNSLIPGSYEVIAGVFVEGRRVPGVQAKQQVVVTAGLTSNITLKLDLNAAKPKP